MVSSYLETQSTFKFKKLGRRLGHCLFFSNLNVMIFTECVSWMSSLHEEKHTIVLLLFLCSPTPTDSLSQIEQAMISKQMHICLLWLRSTPVMLTNAHSESLDNAEISEIHELVELYHIDNMVCAAVQLMIHGIGCKDWLHGHWAVSICVIASWQGLCLRSCLCMSLVSRWSKRLPVIT